jgi:hypothetical protein
MSVPGWLPAELAAGAAPASNVPSSRELARIRQVVETLRGKKFLRDVPARQVSEKELRAMVDRDLAKEYPGRKLAELQELMAWLDLLPPKADLKTICEDLMVEDAAGLYDTDTKTMCVPAPSPAAATPPADKRPAQKKLDELAGLDTGIIFAHEYTHALEDQYWPFDDPKQKQSHASTDADTARTFLEEGSATRLMLEALPAELAGREPGTYILVWNLLHSGAGEFAMNYVLSRLWQGPDAEVPGVPETLSRSEAMPYSYGYSFCRGLMLDWGLDGLDYIYNHPPISSKQVMHPARCWEWRHFPVQVSLSQSLPGAWKLLTEDTVGEAGVAVLLGVQLKDLGRGLRLARGWKGDRAALYQGPDGARLLVWASAWDSPDAAERFARACAEERTRVRNATLTLTPADSTLRAPHFLSTLAPQPSPLGRHSALRAGRAALAWARPDGCAGIVRFDGKRVLVLETDRPNALEQVEAGPGPATFTEPPQDAARAAANHALLRFNPLLSWKKDGDYSVTQSLGGLLERHDQNSIGAADRILLGILGEYRRTSSFRKWKLGWGLVAKHQSEARRGTTKTTLLPWGILQSHFSTPWPQAPTNTLSRDTLVWGLAASRTSVSAGEHALRILPGGLLLRSTTAPGKQALHLLGTGVSRDGTTTRVRIFGVPVRTTHAQKRTTADSGAVPARP